MYIFRYIMSKVAVFEHLYNIMQLRYCEVKELVLEKVECFHVITMSQQGLVIQISEQQTGEAENF